jgi:hypothetical protein
MANPSEIRIGPIPIPTQTERKFYRRHLGAIFWCFAVLCGILHTMAVYPFIDADGISYLDMADAFLRHDWNMIINGFWSPLYPWLLSLPLYFMKGWPYEEAVLSVVFWGNFAIYFLVLNCFHFFIHRLSQYYRWLEKDESANGGKDPLPAWFLIPSGYLLFIWSSLYMIKIDTITPDMVVAGFMYLSTGLLLGIRMDPRGWFKYIVLGICLGLGYLAKTVVFPLAFVFFTVAFFSRMDFRKSIPRVIGSLLIFFVITAPFFITLTTIKGRFTIGDSGKLNYAWFVLNAPPLVGNWQGAPVGSGKPAHPVRKIFASPEIYEFATPIGGTYPPWYDPSYWNEGLEIHFNWMKQIHALFLNIAEFVRIFFSIPAIFFLTLALFFFLVERGEGFWKRVWAHSWILLTPAISALGLYSLLFLRERYIAPFFVIFWLGTLSATRLKPFQNSQKSIRQMISAMLIIIIFFIGFTTVLKGYWPLYLYLQGKRDRPHEYFQLADALHRFGIQSGDGVAVIGMRYTFGMHLARARVIAETPMASALDFWAADSETKSKIYEIFKGTGAKLIIADGIRQNLSSLPPGWERIGDTNFYAYALK